MFMIQIGFWVCLACVAPTQSTPETGKPAQEAFAHAARSLSGTFNFVPHMIQNKEAEPELPPNALEFENDRADNPKAWRRHGMKLYNEGRYEEALTAFNQAIILKKNDAGTWNNKGAALAKLERYEEALEAYETALSFRPNFEQAWHNKGVALDKLKRTEEALEAYEKVLNVNPSNAEAWKNKSAALSVLGRYFEALSAVNEALGYDPNLKDALELKAELEAKIKTMRFQL